MVHFTDIGAVAFDLDGTLVDSALSLTSALNQALQAMQLPTPRIEHVSTWIGNGTDTMLERALNWALSDRPNTAQLRDARNLFDHHYAITAESDSQLYPHVTHVLATLTKHNIPLAVVTNKPTAFVAPILCSLNIAQYFVLTIGGDGVVVKKPHPAPLFLVLGTLGLLPQQLLFVGDSRNDILAAQAAGCPCVGMTYGYNYGEPITNSYPNFVLDNFNELLPILGL